MYLRHGVCTDLRLNYIPSSLLPIVSVYCGSVTMSRNPPVKARSWWRAHFYDHPLAGPHPAADSPALVSGKVKVFCKLCFDHWVAEELTIDQRRVERGEIQAIRSREIIVAHCKLLIH